MATSTTANPSYSTDLRVPQLPDIDERKYPEIYSAVSTLFIAMRTLQSYIDLYLTPVITAKATEAINAGAAVSFVAVSDGSIGIQNASNNVAGKECDAFALQTVAAGTGVDCQTFGTNDLISGVVIGQRYYLGVGGSLLTVPPVAAGTLVQEVGIGITPNSYLFRPAKYVKQN